MKKNLLVGNGVNIQHGGYEWSNAAIILRTLQNYIDPNFPQHDIITEPILAKCYIGYLFLEISKIVRGAYDRFANCSSEREFLEEFKKRYKGRKSLKITDVGFEDFYFIHDMLCHREGIMNPDRYYIRESLKVSFIHAIYDNGKVNTLGSQFAPAFITWLKEFDRIFTTNYDDNIENATGIQTHHLHGDFVTRSDAYNPESIRNQVSDRPCEKASVDESLTHLYSTALSTYSGDYKQYRMQEGTTANSAIEKMAIGYKNNPEFREQVDTWENDRNILVARMREAILAKCKDPSLHFSEPYPVHDFQDITGELTILGLSPYNDRHLFSIINDSSITRCLFYFYNQSEQDIIRTLLPNINVEFEDVRNFWGAQKKTKSREANGKEKRTRLKVIKSSDFHKFAEGYRALSASIMSDADIINEFNKIPYSKRMSICQKFKKQEDAIGLSSDQQFVWRIVNIHMLAEEFSIAPAVIYCVAVDGGKNEIYRLGAG